MVAQDHSVLPSTPNASINQSREAADADMIDVGSLATADQGDWITIP